MKRRAFTMGLLAASLGVASSSVALPVAADDEIVTNQSSQRYTAIPVAGSGADGVFRGTFNIRRFESSGDQLVAVGILSGTLTAPGGTRKWYRFDGVQMPAVLTSGSTAIGVAASGLAASGELTAAQVACPILNLVLGPLDLNLLGLRVQLNQVVLNLTAVPGAGNLLGNLLCAVAALLNGTQTLLQIVALLNALLALLRGA